MRVDRILAVADAIEGHTIADLGFNMGVWEASINDQLWDMSGQGCGTVACIAGWTVHVARKIWPEEENTFRDVIESSGPTNGRRFAEYVLDLSSKIADDLFIPVNFDDNIISAKQAVRTLRHFAATQVIDFTVGANDEF